MFWILISIFIVIPAIEIGIFIWTGNLLGVWAVISLIILTGLIGTLFVRYQGLELLKSAQSSMQRGEVPTEQMLDGLCIILGAVLLITPGFLTDTIGFLLVLPWTRKPFKLLIIHFIKKNLNNGTFIFRRW